MGNDWMVVEVERIEVVVAVAEVVREVLIDEDGGGWGGGDCPDMEER